MSHNNSNNLEYKGTPVNIIRSKRKTIAIQLKPSEIIVRAPRRMSQEVIEDFIHEKSAWIDKHQKIMAEEAEQIADLPDFTSEEIRSLADKALEVIPERVRHYAPLIGVSYGRITIRNQRTRWGSCSSKGNLNFNCLLMLTPDEVIDIVVVHELCHRKHMDHSKAFYAEVEKVFPEYRSCEKWLKDNGWKLLRRMP